MQNEPQLPSIEEYREWSKSPFTLMLISALEQRIEENKISTATGAVLMSKHPLADYGQIVGSTIQCTEILNLIENDFEAGSRGGNDGSS